MNRFAFRLLSTPNCKNLFGQVADELHIRRHGSFHSLRDLAAFHHDERSSRYASAGGAGSSRSRAWGTASKSQNSGRRPTSSPLYGDSVTSDFNGKSIVVTGGSLAWGLACAHRFAAGGGKVTIVANDKASVDEAWLPSGTMPPGSSRRPLQARHEAAVSGRGIAHGGVDILACLRRIQRYGTVVDTPDEVWDDVLDINLKGIFLASKFAIPEMRKRGGREIVAISSVQAYASQAGVAPIRRAKARSTHSWRAMALDHAGDNITVNAVCPASVDTPMLRWAADLWKGEGTAEETLEAWGRGHPLGRVGKPSEIANWLPFLPAIRPASSRAPTSRSDGGVLSKLGIVIPD